MEENNGGRLLRLGLPIGSLNDPERWDTEELVKLAGYNIRGYKPGSRSFSPEIVNDNELEVFASRPQDMPEKLNDGVFDLAIVGRDWAEEWRNAGIELEEMLDLEYGKVRIVVAVPEQMPVATLSELVAYQQREGKILRCKTEYTLLTQKRFRKEGIDAAIRSRYDPKAGGIVVISESFGGTEANIRVGAADLITEAAQSGRTLQENALKSIDVIMESTARLYTTRYALSDSWKAGKIEEVRVQFEGAVNARTLDYVVFDAPKGNWPKLMCFLKENRLYAEEPTVVDGVDWMQVSVLTPRSDWPRMSRELVAYGAKSIIRLTPQQVIGWQG